MAKEHCSNCGWELTKENVALAKEDAGVVDGDELTYCSPSYTDEVIYRCPSYTDELTYCCPSYTDEHGCLGYSEADRELPAYWRTN